MNAEEPSACISTESNLHRGGDGHGSGPLGKYFPESSFQVVVDIIAEDWARRCLPIIFGSHLPWRPVHLAIGNHKSPKPFRGKATPRQGPHYGKMLPAIFTLRGLP